MPMSYQQLLADLLNQTLEIHLIPNSASQGLEADTAGVQTTAHWLVP